MRVAYICADSGVPVFGSKGCSIHVQEIVRAMQRQGAQVELFATRFDGDPPPALETVPIHEIPVAPKREPALRERSRLAANHDLRAMLERNGSFDLIYERYSLWSYAGMKYAQAVGVPGLLEVNAPLVEERAKHGILVDRPGAERVEEKVFSLAKGLIAVSKELVDYLERYPAARGRVHLLSNGVDPDRFPVGLQPSYPTEPGTFTVGFLGTLKPWHGLPLLVEAFAEVHGRDPDSLLLIVGDGPERSSLMADLSERGLDKAVYLTGAVAPSDVPGLLASMDVGVAPYPQQPHFYFSPLKVYEYMAAGLPVVASRIGQVARVIQDGVNGLLCPPGDAGALAAVLDRLRREPELRARLGESARETVIQKHTWDAVVTRIFHLAGLEVFPEHRGLEARR